MTVDKIVNDYGINWFLKKNMWNWTTEDEILPYKKISWDKFERGKQIWIKTLEIARKAFTEKTWLPLVICEK